MKRRRARYETPRSREADWISRTVYNRDKLIEANATLEGALACAEQKFRIADDLCLYREREMWQTIIATLESMIRLETKEGGMKNGR